MSSTLDELEWPMALATLDAMVQPSVADAEPDVRDSLACLSKTRI